MFLQVIITPAADTAQSVQSLLFGRETIDRCQTQSEPLFNGTFIRLRGQTRTRGSDSGVGLGFDGGPGSECGVIKERPGAGLQGFVTNGLSDPNTAELM